MFNISNNYNQIDSYYQDNLDDISYYIDNFCFISHLSTYSNLDDYIIFINNI